MDDKTKISVKKVKTAIYTNEDLKTMQSWNLQKKIQVTTTRILEWYQKWECQCYVSFSGGKDSTVLADLCARVCKANGYKLTLWFSNTGLEYPEIIKHTKFFAEWLKEQYQIEVDLIIDSPKDKDGKRITFKDVILKYGYPIISKEVALKIYHYRRNPNGCMGKFFDDNSEHIKKYGKRFSLSRWKYLRDSNIPISHKCCDEMKKKPSKKFEKESRLKPIVGTMACESSMRKTQWQKTGCNSFNGDRPMSKPISFWVEQDVLKYLKDFNIPYATVYGDIVEEKGKLKTTGCDRTGCYACMFGCHLEKEPNKFQRLKQTHPKLWEYCMKDLEEGGLGIKKVLDFIGVKVE